MKTAIHGFSSAVQDAVTDICWRRMIGASRRCSPTAWSVSVKNTRTASMRSSGVVQIRGSTHRSATTADWSSTGFHEPLNTTSCCERSVDFIPRPAYWPARLRPSSFSNKNGRRWENNHMTLMDVEYIFNSMNEHSKLTARWRLTYLLQQNDVTRPAAVSIIPQCSHAC